MEPPCQIAIMSRGADDHKATNAEISRDSQMVFPPLPVQRPAL